MKNGLNKVTLIGNVGDAPRVNETKDHLKVANFPLATNEGYKDKNGKEVERTEWHKVVVWNKQAEIVNEYVKKGDPLYVEGKIRTTTWDDKDGNKRYSTEIICENFLFLSSRNS